MVLLTNPDAQQNKMVKSKIPIDYNTFLVCILWYYHGLFKILNKYYTILRMRTLKKQHRAILTRHNCYFSFEKLLLIIRFSCLWKSLIYCSLCSITFFSERLCLAKSQIEKVITWRIIFTQGKRTYSL